MPSRARCRRRTVYCQWGKDFSKAIGRRETRNQRGHKGTTEEKYQFQVAKFCSHADNIPVLRNKNLIPLSHQHQHALALCVRIERAALAGVPDLEPWQAEIQQIFEQEVRIHFAAEEKTLFPAAEEFADLCELVAELREEHAKLRALFSQAAERALDQEGLRTFGQSLSAHIRKEERQLFEAMQQRMTAEGLDGLGRELGRELAGASDACILPNEATRLRGKQ